MSQNSSLSRNSGESVSNPYANLEDEKLMQLYLDDEPQAFDEIYSRYSKKIYQYLSKRLRSSSDVDEVFQKAMLKFHKARYKYDAKFSLLAWFYTLAKNELYDHCKKKNLDLVPLHEDQVEQQFEVDSTPLDQLDLENIPGLKPKQKKAIELRYYNDKDFSEIAQLLETSPMNARKLISRGLKIIRLSLVGRNVDE